MSNVSVNYASVSRAYPLIAILEKVGTEAWHDQYEPGKDDLAALQNGEVSPRMQSWIEHRHEVDAQVQRKLASGQL